MSVSAPRRGPLHRAARWLLHRLGAAPPAPPHQPSPDLQGEALRRYTRLALVTRRQAPSGAGGDHRGRARTPSHDFVDYRQYQPGDDVRRVDWNVYGRLGTLHVRLTEAHEPLELVLALDCSASMRWGEPDKLDYAARLASALATIALAHGDAVRLAYLGGESRALGPWRGRAHAHAVVRALAAVEPDGQADLGRELAGCLSLGGAARQGRPLVVVLSDLLASEGLEDGLDALLRQRAEVVVLHVLSPQEQHPDAVGEVELVDAESGATLEVGLGHETLGRYRQRLERWLDDVEQACRTRGLRYVRVGTDRPLEMTLLDDLRRAKVLR